MNQTPIISNSKKQNTVETSTFSSEFIALRIVVEKVIALRYIVRMFGILLDSPVQVFCDSESVMNNRVCPESRLNKKYLSCVYHKARESIAVGTILLFFERENTHLEDFLTKSSPPAKRKQIINGLFG